MPLNIERVEKLIEYLERDDIVLGRFFLYNALTGERCALGHAATLAEIDPQTVGYDGIYAYYGFTEDQGDGVFKVNDAPYWSDEERKNAVIAYLRNLIAEARGGAA